MQLGGQDDEDDLAREIMGIERGDSEEDEEEDQDRYEEYDDEES